MDCELCGRRATGRAFVEGSIVAVCDNCSNMGKKVYEPKPVKLPEKRKEAEPESVYFVQNFSSVIKQARERKSLTREHLADRIRERASVIERIEKGMRPERSVAEKLEKELGIRLISSVDSEKTVFKQESSGSLTLGDVVVVKKRKK